jgi:YD repeat-containing protein
MGLVPITNSAIYGKGTGAVYPMVDLMDPTHVVSSVTSSDGIGGNTTTSYTYYYARADLQGRGFLGFQAINTALPNGQLHQQWFTQAYPYTGMLSSDLLYRDDWTNVVQRSDAGYGATSLGGTRYFVYPTTTIAKSWDLNGTFMSWNESSLSNYDAYGNAQNTSTISKDVNGTADGYSTSTVTAFLNDTTNWILGLPTSVTVTKNRPSSSGAATAANPLSATRNTVMSYFADGLLKQEIVEPNNGGLLGVTNLRLQTDYTYDGFGNLLTKTVSGANITTRNETTLTYEPSRVAHL